MFPARIAVALRERHRVDAVSVRERPDLAGHPDVEVFSSAQAEGRAVVTENVRDFRPLARAWEAEGKIRLANRPLGKFRAIPSRAKPASRMILADRE